jgi:tRNA uridine 5-carboxymethylaminomethyl modification enzyme
LHLRIDNADRRLTPHGRRVGLISDEAWQDFQAKQERLTAMKKLLERTKLTGEMAEKLLRHGFSRIDADQEQGDLEQGKVGSTVPAASLTGQTLAQLLKRPEIGIEHMASLLRELDSVFFARQEIRENPLESAVDLPSQVRNELKSVETEIKYEGYLLQQQRAMERLKKSEQRSIPAWFDYHTISGLSHEMQEKLSRVQPRTIAQASRIPGVTPAAVSLVNVYIEIQAKRREQAAAL